MSQLLGQMLGQFLDSLTDDDKPPPAGETEDPPDPTEAIQDFTKALLDCIDTKIVQEGIEYQRARDYEAHANAAGL